jgi:hypothetical protein
MTGRVIDHERRSGESSNSAHHKREGDADSYTAYMEVLLLVEQLPLSDVSRPLAMRASIKSHHARPLSTVTDLNAAEQETL